MILLGKELRFSLRLFHKKEIDFFFFVFNKGPIIYDSIYNGETYDARLEKLGWSSAGYDDSNWSFAGKVSGPMNAILSVQVTSFLSLLV